MKRLFAAALICALCLIGPVCAEEATSISTPVPAAPAPTVAPVAAAPTVAPAAARTIAPAAAPTAAPAAAAGGYAAGQTVTIRRSGDVNVRKQPAYSSDRIGIARAGRTYALLETAENGWYKIRLTDGREGYISPKLVQGAPQESTAQRVIIHKSGDANVRQEPDASSRRVGVARAGRSYPLLSTAENGWHRILLTGGAVGYVSPKVVSRVTNPGENPDATPTPVPTSTGETVRIRQKANVNVRQEPQYSSARVGTATAGKRYPLLETAENGWYKIRLENGVEGYISPKLAN